MVLLVAAGATAETANALSDAEMQGRALAQKILEQRPAENFTNFGVLKIRDGQGSQTNLSIKCEVIVTSTNWQSIYETVATNQYLNGFRLPWLDVNSLKIIHAENRTTEYHLHWQHNAAVSRDLEKSWSASSASNFLVGGSFGDFRSSRGEEKWSGTEWVHPFSNSDFWAADLGLEFFHWPQQKVLPKPTSLKRGRDYTLLESTNPSPSTNGYSRVLSWIDKETGGVLEAEAYDFNGKLLKDFAPKSFKKVNGQWELQEMEIRNVQTGSRTRLEFDLNK